MAAILARNSINVLSAYPYMGTDPQQLALAAELKELCELTDNDDEVIQTHNNRLMTPGNVDMMAAGCLMVPSTINSYFKIIKLSGYCSGIDVASTNAVNILKKAGISFSGLDWSGCRFPDADFSGVVLHKTNLSYADIRRGNFTNAFLRETDLRGARLDHLEFGQRSLEHESEVLATALSPDEQYLLSTDQKTVSLWNLQTGQLAARIANLDHLSLTFLKGEDDYSALSGDSHGNIHIWKFPDMEKKLITRAHDGPVDFLEYSADRTLLISGSINTGIIKIWKVTRDNLQNLMLIESNKLELDQISEVRLSPTGSLLGVLSSGQLYLWILPDLDPIKVYGEQNFSSFQIKTDDEGVLTARDGCVSSWDFNKNDIGWEMRYVREVFSERAAVLNLHYLPDSRLLAYTCEEDGMSNTICLRKLSNYNLVSRYFGRVSALNHSSRHDQLIGVQTHTILILKISQLVHCGISPFTKEIQGISFSKDSQYVSITVKNPLRLYGIDVMTGDIRSCEEIATPPNYEKTSVTMQHARQLIEKMEGLPTFTEVQISPDSRFVACSCSVSGPNPVIYLWEIKSDDDIYLRWRYPKHLNAYSIKLDRTAELGLGSQNLKLLMQTRV